MILPKKKKLKIGNFLIDFPTDFYSIFRSIFFIIFFRIWIVNFDLGDELKVFSIQLSSLLFKLRRKQNNKLKALQVFLIALGIFNFMVALNSITDSSRNSEIEITRCCLRFPISSQTTDFSWKVTLRMSLAKVVYQFKRTVCLRPTPLKKKGNW